MLLLRLSLRRIEFRSAVLSAALVLCACVTTLAVDEVAFRRDGQTNHLSGKAVVQAQDGGIMLLTPDGKLWNILPKELIDHHEDDKPFVPLTAEQLKKQTLADLPAGFDTVKTAHYLIFYNTSRGYALWCSALFERLYTSFISFWTHRGFKLHEPEMPLVVLIYANRGMYAKQSVDELQGNSNRVMGFYSLQTNRVKTYDLTGAESLHDSSDNKRLDAAQINDLLSRPETTMMVATVIHEATHQIAFNCGLQQRFADIPLWVCEGLAMYFETPDLGYGKGWRTIGEVNPLRLQRFQEYLLKRPVDSLQTLIVDDKRFRSRDAQQALDAYAEAWALNYFLLRLHTKEYEAYLQRLAEKEPLWWDDPAARLKEFKAAFGSDLNTLDAEFVRYMARVK
ncbi:MAG TPA: DUF1570 domain-containing protein [Pirellulales bacterium]|jgi:hypothetical protein|nr:DUF1570 domain-containing protein [Pirellulales bacterium]